MPASVQQRRRERGMGMVMKEKDEELGLFLEMRDRDKEKINLLFDNSDDFDDQLGPKVDTSQISNVDSTLTGRKTNAFLDSENDKTDYNWLMTPPATPLFPSLEMEAQKTAMSQLGISKAMPTALKSKPSDPTAEAVPRSSMTTSAGNRRSSSAGRLRSSASRPTIPSTAKASRPSTPTSRATLPSAKPKAPPIRSSTPTGSTARSSTPNSRPSIAVSSKSTSRAGTPKRRSSTPSSIARTSAPPDRASSVTKSRTTLPKNSLPSRGPSPTVKSRPLKTYDMPGFSHNAIPNLKTSTTIRPSSASRGRPGVASNRTSTVEHSSSGRQGRKSCSPSRGRGPHGGNAFPAMTRARSNNNDDMNPVLIGTKMVERVVNMRKLAPPKQNDNLSGHDNTSEKSSLSRENSEFGRTLSKTSLDMALRHMDIRRSIPGNLRQVKTNIPASSVYSVRSGSTKSRTVSVSDSPLATSSNASSELSINNNSYSLDGTEEDDNDLGSQNNG